MSLVRLGDVCEVTTGQAAPQIPDAFSSSGVPFVRAGSLQALCAGSSESSLELIQPANAKRFRLRLFPEDTVVFAKSGMSANLGRVHRLSQDCYLVSHLAAVLPSPAVDPGYLHRWFECNPASRLIANEAYPSIKTSTIQDIRVPLPPLPEQRRIAAILDKADALRAKRRLAIAKLDQLLQSVFLEMFSGVDFPSVSVADLLDQKAGGIRTGPFGSQLLHSEFVDEGVVVLGIDNAVNNVFSPGKQRYITPEKYATLKRYTVNPGDVLITIMGTCGRCAVVPSNIGVAINTKHLCCITLDTMRCLPEFLHSYFLMHPSARRYLVDRAKGAIMDGLNMGIIKELPVLLPPLATQAEFVRIKESISKMIRAEDVAYSRSETLTSSIQESVFK